jgi:hypothetical protein
MVNIRFLCVCVVLGLEPRATPPALFCDRFFGDSCLSRLGTVFLLISASGVARITGVSHQHPALELKFYIYVHIS